MLRHIVYDFTQGMIANNPQLINSNIDMVPAGIENARKNERVIKEDTEEILNKMINGRDISKPSIDGVAAKK